ncbi:hypothetical protein PI125_g20088 [Phytophthora idaei]|nr:hypothetical protein PI125_g20088 [Phytophthora idaei]
MRHLGAEKMMSPEEETQASVTSRTSEGVSNETAVSSCTHL